MRFRGRDPEQRGGSDARSPGRRRRVQAGQSLTEFVLLLPILMFVALGALDFGRLFQGWVGLQSAARIAANFASLNPSAWVDLSDTSLDAVREKYQLLVQDTADGLDCSLPDTIADPTIPPGAAIGDVVTVDVTCQFTLMTPFMDAFLPNPLTLSAEAAFPIRNGGVGVSVNDSKISAPVSADAGEPITLFDLNGTSSSWCWNFGDGQTYVNGNLVCEAFSSSVTHTYYYTCSTPVDGLCEFTVTLRITDTAGNSTIYTWVIKIAPPPATPTPHPPVADFTAQPWAGTSPLTVQFLDTSTGTPSPNAWCWNFGDGQAWPHCDSTAQNPSHGYTCASGTCVFTVSLTASNGGVSPVVTHTVSVGSPTPVPGTCFTPATLSGSGTLTVNFSSTCTTNSPTAWCWNFGDGQAWPHCDAITQNPSHTYTVLGSYTVTLMATNTGGSYTISHSPFTVQPALCLVPNFANLSVVGSTATNTISSTWTSAGFTGALSYSPLPLPTKGNHKVTAQSLTAGTYQYCTSTITLTWS
jgi:PKD repeat protein